MDRIPIGVDKYRLASRYLWKMVELKKKKNTLELQKIQNEVLKNIAANVKLPFFLLRQKELFTNSLTTRRRKKDESFYRKKIKTSEKEEIRQHSISKDNANIFPTAQFGKNYYLRCPIS